MHNTNDTSVVLPDEYCDAKEVDVLCYKCFSNEQGIRACFLSGNKYQINTRVTVLSWRKKLK